VTDAALDAYELSSVSGRLLPIEHSICVLVNPVQGGLLLRWRFVDEVCLLRLKAIQQYGEGLYRRPHDLRSDSEQ
jgi:hypothetical protein